MKKYIKYLLILSLLLLTKPTNVFAIEDITPPKIKSFSIDKTEIAAPGKVLVTMEITDDISGVNTANILYYNPSRERQIIAWLSNTEGNIWQGYLEFDEYVEAGTYTPYLITICDKADNYLRIYESEIQTEYAEKTINVHNSSQSVLGDMNNNGKIDLKDIIILIKKYLDVDNQDINIGDLNHNGKIDLKDIILLIKTYLNTN